MTAVVLRVVVHSEELLSLRAERRRCGLSDVDDGTLAQIAINAGFASEIAALARLSDGAGTPKPMGALPDGVERDLGVDYVKD